MYIITLAGRNFKILVAIAIRFDLKMLQYNTVNAFVNTPLNKTIYIKMLIRYKEKRKVLYFYKVLYGLKKLPLLWQRHFKSSLIKIRFNTVSHKPYYIIRKRVFIFFYINNIVFTFRKNKIRIIKGVVRELKTKYQFIGGGKLQWFLGI